MCMLTLLVAKHARKENVNLANFYHTRVQLKSRVDCTLLT